MRRITVAVVSAAHDLKQLRPLRSATLAINGTRQTFAPAIPAEKQAFLEAIHRRGLTH